jgi:hypothetical protein
MAVVELSVHKKRPDHVLVSVAVPASGHHGMTMRSTREFLEKGNSIISFSWRVSPLLMRPRRCCRSTYLRAVCFQALLEFCFAPLCLDGLLEGGAVVVGAAVARACVGAGVDGV